MGLQWHLLVTNQLQGAQRTGDHATDDAIVVLSQTPAALLAVAPLLLLGCIGNFAALGVVGSVQGAFSGKLCIYRGVCQAYIVNLASLLMVVSTGSNGTHTCCCLAADLLLDLPPSLCKQTQLKLEQMQPTLQQLRPSQECLASVLLFEQHLM